MPRAVAKYWNIDDILSEEERVPAEFQITAHKLGHLDQSSASPVCDLE
jgi:hypothetical protein